MKKITKKENFTTIKEILEEMGKQELAEVMQHEIDLLDKKATSGKKTATQVVNDEIKNIILEELAKLDKAYTITDILAKSEPIAKATGNSNQKTSALFKQLKDNGQIERIQDGKKALFKIA